jgi:hypothetical protein
MDGPVLRERGERGFEAETAIKSAHRHRGEELVLLGANFDKPLAVRRVTRTISPSAVRP